MFNHGARHIYLTSRRGRKALSAVSKLYLRDINNKGGDARAISCDALRETDMARRSQHGHRQLLRLWYFFLCPGGRNSRQIGFARVQSWRPRTSTQGGERVRSWVVRSGCGYLERRFKEVTTALLVTRRRHNIKIVNSRRQRPDPRDYLINVDDFVVTNRSSIRSLVQRARPESNKQSGTSE